MPKEIEYIKICKKCQHVIANGMFAICPVCDNDDYYIEEIEKK